MFQFDLKVVELPLISKFRGINKREIALFEGSAGWSEFSPFLEYGAKESAIWLKAAISGATNSYFNNLRNEIEINALLPNVEKSEVKNLNQIEIY
jgi:O-succinylbenzoate synthase